MSVVKRKILMLGGAYSQLPAIEYAKSAGYHVITCDYLPENPGHQISDEYHNVSTTDQEKVLQLARACGVDGIVAYASDPSALSAAYVCREMGLPGASYDAVRILSRKDLFRRFQDENGFNCKPFRIISSSGEIDRIRELNFPLVVKPVDSSGSKGVGIVHGRDTLSDAVMRAFSYSRCKKVIAEEYIETPYHQLHGDGFVRDGELIFLGLCDHYFRGMAPVSSVYPSTLPEDMQQAVRGVVQDLLIQVGFRDGAINVEVRVGEGNSIYILEIGPRSGGNYMPQLMQCATGFDEVKAIVELAMGKRTSLNLPFSKNKSLSYTLGATADGRYEGLQLSDRDRQCLVGEYLHMERQQAVKTYNSSADVVGVLIARYDDHETLKGLMEGFSRCVLTSENEES